MAGAEGTGGRPVSSSCACAVSERKWTSCISMEPSSSEPSDVDGRLPNSLRSAVTAPLARPSSSLPSFSPSSPASSSSSLSPPFWQSPLPPPPPRRADRSTKCCTDTTAPFAVRMTCSRIATHAPSSSPAPPRLPAAPAPSRTSPSAAHATRAPPSLSRTLARKCISESCVSCDDFIAASEGSTSTWKAVALPRAVPALSSLPTRKHTCSARRRREDDVTCAQPRVCRGMSSRARLLAACTNA
eukprot:269254-Pleurochrysis_carterae.AAC.2